MYSITNNPYKTNQCWHQTIQIQMNHSVYQATSHTGSPEPQSLRKFIIYAGFKFCIMYGRSPSCGKRIKLNYTQSMGIAHVLEVKPKTLNFINININSRMCNGLVCSGWMCASVGLVFNVVLWMKDKGHTTTQKFMRN